ncbi:hypothetical protein H2200_003524 [Cladophialophora chaetospira]|uniref:Uncharacterized protein n=1 Tax=Cladophialophora chaetospira TaxID=386627 RepID=A0AA39CMD2_9EURO|nr:hypothetical protein H2200_003524 [Cladophialophora chaetospira]
MGKVQIHEHTTSYQAITTKSPHGLQCLKKLFLEYDNETPSRASLDSLLARDFTDNENESERSIGREESIENIISNRKRCSRHQMDLKRAVCIEHDAKRQEVLFEGVRFMLFPFEDDRGLELPIVEDKGDWIRVPFSGRIEVRTKENRYTLKEAVIEIVSRRWTVDNSQLVKRELMSNRRSQSRTATATGPVSPISSPSETLLRSQSTGQSQSSQSHIGLPGGMSELPAALSGLVVHDTKSLPPYPGSVAGSSVDGRA